MRSTRATSTGPRPVGRAVHHLHHRPRRAAHRCLTRNPKWWGTTPRLEQHHLPGARRRRPDSRPAEQRHRRRRRRTPRRYDHRPAHPGHRRSGARRPAVGITSPSTAHPDPILADPALRLAICKGIDRQTIANVVQHGLTGHPVPLNNHIYVAGQEGYQDNSASAAYNPDAGQAGSRRAWAGSSTAQCREKDGKQLVIRDVFFDAQPTRQIALVAQQNLAQIGVKLDLARQAGTGFFTQYVSVGDFDVAQFGWVGDAFPLSALHPDLHLGRRKQLRQNRQPRDRRQDRADARPNWIRTRPAALANEVDKMIWAGGLQPAAVPVAR